MHNAHKTAARNTCLRNGLMLAASCVIGATSVAVASPDDACQPNWLATFGGVARANADIRTMAVFDDGNGPALFVGGDFTAIGGIPASRIARFDGQSWSDLAGGLTPAETGGYVSDMIVFDDGSGDGPSLFVAGSFANVSGMQTSGVVRWDGASWSSVGEESEWIVALEVMDDGTGGGPALFAGGWFTVNGGEAIQSIAKWNGTTWDVMPGGVSQGQVRAMTALGSKMIIGGNFDQVNGWNSPKLAQWSSAGWAGFGNGTTHGVSQLETFDLGDGPLVFASGAFTTITGLNIQNVAQYDGSWWSAIGDGPHADVHQMLLFDNGSGPAMYGGTSDGLARWDGKQWTAVAPLPGFSFVLPMAVFDDGSGPAIFAYAHQQHPTVLKWDGEAWSHVGDVYLEHPKHLAVLNDGEGAGLFASAPSEPAAAPSLPLYDQVVKWDNGAWVPLGDVMNGIIRAMFHYNDGAGNAIHVAGGHGGSGYVVRWDDGDWTTIAQMHDVYSATVFNDGTGPAIYASGMIELDGTFTRVVARWDGRQWHSMGHAQVATALAVADVGDGPALYAGGTFEAIGGVSASGIARWNGSGWSALGSGVTGSSAQVHTMLVFDDGSGPALYVGGRFNEAGGEAAANLARWDGKQWSAVGDVAISGSVRSLAVYDDGSGPALFVGTKLPYTDPTSAFAIAKWDGTSWSQLLGGALPNAPWVPGDPSYEPVSVLSMVTYDMGDGAGPALILGGNFLGSPAGDTHFARYGGCTEPTMLGDLNNDGVINTADLLQLLNAWGQCPDPNNCSTDITEDGEVNVADLLMLLANWSQ